MTDFAKRTLVLLAGASTLAACTSYSPEPPRPNFPVTRQPGPGPAPPYPESVREEPPIPEAPPPPSAVQSQPLPPPGAATSPPSQPGYTPPAAVETRTRTETRTSVTGRVVDADGPPVTYTVKSGDNLIRIAREMGVSQSELARLNDLEAPYVIRPGQRLKGPSSKRKAYQVVSGDTLYAIGRRFNVQATAIATANEMELDDPIRPGQRLLLPEGFRDGGPITQTYTVTETVPVERPAYQPPAYQPPPVQPQPQPPRPQPPPAPVQPPPAPAPTPAPPVTPTPTPAPPAVVTAADQEIQRLGRGRFVWPLRGEMIRGFGPIGSGQRNDGIKLRAGAGAPVRAAAAGEVVYAGDQVPTFGNLVLIKHADGWVTAYAHLSRIEVSNQARVSQGQQIGQVGSTGGVDEPQLHFEVRYQATAQERARPIDPLLVLPR